ncbi:MAG: alpha/beta fold hydrolase [Actinobacteria bacterium]|nr:alpha/beta fold hydrolase [Actinomycetota bacterium]
MTLPAPVRRTTPRRPQADPVLGRQRGRGEAVATYVLVHGAWHGAWCWEYVAPLLEKEGHRVEVPDLPGHGEDETPISEVSLQACVDRVCAVLDAQPEPVILVAHSLGGAVASQTAEQRASKIRNLVYVTAFLFMNGQSRTQLGPLEGSVLGPDTLVVADDKTRIEVRADSARQAFYHDCSDEDSARAASRLGPEAMALLTTPVRLTDQNFGRIPRDYIECLLDQAIPLSTQRSMHTALPCRRVTSMDTAHSPFYAKPDELAGHLLASA